MAKKIALVFVVAAAILTGCILYSNHVDAENQAVAAHSQSLRQIESLKADVGQLQTHLEMCDVTPKCAPSLKRDLQKQLTEKQDALAGAEYAAQ